jgi:glycosyltransferase involved in cell wall biosynthesis
MTTLYVDQSIGAVGHLEDATVAGLSERHHLRLPTVQLIHAQSIEQDIREPTTAGVVFALSVGLPNRATMRLAWHALRHGRAVFLYWPAESAIEVVDRERFWSLARHWLAYQVGTRLIRWRRERRRAEKSALLAPATAHVNAGDLAEIDNAAKFVLADFTVTQAHIAGAAAEVKRMAVRLADVDDRLRPLLGQLGSDTPDAARTDLHKMAENLAGMRSLAASLESHVAGGLVALERIATNLQSLAGSIGTMSGPAPLPQPESEPFKAVLDDYRKALAEFAPAVVAFDRATALPTHDDPIEGAGVYLRTAYWAHLISGGSYGHTAYVAAELARVTERFVCLMGTRFALIDDLGIHQEIVTPQFTAASERDLLAADGFYYRALRERLRALRPAYIYERLVLGNFAAARLSRELGIPYIVEYNGSEISMSRSFGSGALEHEELFLEAERVAFQQATVITAISDAVRDDIVRRGIDERKVLVNPNGVNCDEYAPATAEERREIRAALGLADDHCVIAFIGTFGGWHGIDVLAASLGSICQQAPKARFLLIGDGNLKHLVTDAVREHGLQDRVVDIGRTEQRQGARYLKAADIYVSPHSSHMVDSKFFGSPTKLFEYMALGGGIVASDLEQIGVTLSPALRPTDFAGRTPVVGDERAVLCRPGDVDDFVAGVLALVRHPDISSALGRNARAAAIEHFSWERHVARIWDFALGLGQEAPWRRNG